MHLNIFALDLDGTLAENDQVAPATWKILRKAKSKGFRFILVTGRRLEELAAIGPFETYFEAIVAENGAVIHFVASDTVIMPFGSVAADIIQELGTLNIPVTRGMAIAATWKPHDQQILNVLAARGFPVTLEYNREAVMLLPPGATKGTGLLAALQELGYSYHNVLAIGDAENDRSLFSTAEYAVAVANADPGIKKTTDLTLALPNGAGIQQFMDGLINNKNTLHSTRSKHLITLGKKRDQSPFQLSTFHFIDGNLGVFGASGSGKSWLSGLLAEALLLKDYQICIIDPEGDHRNIKKFPHTILLGGTAVPPPALDQVATLLEYSTLNIILDLSLYTKDQQIVYVQDLLQLFCSLRNRRGKPHWILLEEAHYFCSSNDDQITLLLHRLMEQGGLSLVSYRPSQLAPDLLKKLDQWLFTYTKSQEELEAIKTMLPESAIQEHDFPACLFLLGNQQAYYCSKNKPDTPLVATTLIEFSNLSRMVPHVRHLHKYLHAPLARDKQFFFKNDGQDKKLLVAANLHDFSEMLPQLPMSVLKYHLYRGDFKNWLQHSVHDHELARLVQKITNRQLPDELLKSSLTETVAIRIAALESLL
ncbi:MAG: hypothetical protein DA408_03510 [Bacteroidetes bacterium]|nr:MAG: hypothetical protein C7N36_00340 [Bacteroidota bacterium]PTM14353.1 MAG: hypothetical protein DA408_03510 [Bacteroidota bacterium]